MFWPDLFAPVACIHGACPSLAEARKAGALICFYFLTTSCCGCTAGEAETRTTEKELASEVAVASESAPTAITSAGPEAPKLDLAGDYISHSKLPFIAL